MKKIMLLAACTAALVHAANAQKFAIAPEIGLNIANMHGKDSTYTGVETRKDVIKLGVKAGINVNIPVGSRVEIQPGIFYSIKGYKHDENQSYTGFTYEQHDNVTLHYFEIPVNVQYNFNDVGEGRLFVGIGGYVGIAFAGHNKYSSSSTYLGALGNSTDTTVKLTFGDDRTKVGPPQTEFRRVDGGVSANVGYLLQSGIFFRGMYQLGLANLVPGENSNNTLMNSLFTISLGYQLGGRPESNKRKAKAGGNM